MKLTEHFKLEEFEKSPTAKEAIDLYEPIFKKDSDLRELFDEKKISEEEFLERRQKEGSEERVIARNRLNALPPSAATMQRASSVEGIDMSMSIILMIISSILPP